MFSAGTLLFILLCLNCFILPTLSKRAIILFRDNQASPQDYRQFIKILESEWPDNSTTVIVPEELPKNVSYLDSVVLNLRQKLQTEQNFNFSSGDLVYVATHGFKPTGIVHQRWAKSAAYNIRPYYGHIFLNQRSENALRMFFSDNVTFISGSWVKSPGIVEFCQRFTTDVLNNRYANEGFGLRWTRQHAMQIVEKLTDNTLHKYNNDDDETVPAQNARAIKAQVANVIANWIRCMEGNSSSCSQVEVELNYTRVCAETFDTAERWDRENICPTFVRDNLNLQNEFATIPLRFSNFTCFNSFQCVLDSHPTGFPTTEAIIGTEINVTDAVLSEDDVTDNLQYIESLHLCKSKVREYFFDMMYNNAVFLKFNPTLPRVFGPEPDASFTQNKFLQQALIFASVPQFTRSVGTPASRFNDAGKVVNLANAKIISSGLPNFFSYQAVITRNSSNVYILSPLIGRGAYFDLNTGSCPVPAGCNLRAIGSLYPKFADTKELLRFLWATSFLEDS